MNLHTLRERVRAADGPDRELDAAITVALTPPRKKTPDDLIYLRETTKSDDCAPGTYWLIQRSGMSLRTAEPLTGSLDAAATLIPPGYDWNLHVDNGEAIAGCMPASEDGCDCADFAAATPAPALCGAALSALITQENEDAG